MSRFYPKYSEAETNEQYDRCLKSHRGGATLRTFFWLAGQAGLRQGDDREEVEDTELATKKWTKD